MAALNAAPSPPFASGGCVPISCETNSRGEHVSLLAVLVLLAVSRPPHAHPDCRAGCRALPPSAGSVRPACDSRAEQIRGAGDSRKPLRQRRNPARGISAEEAGPRRLTPP